MTVAISRRLARRWALPLLLVPLVASAQMLHRDTAFRPVLEFAIPGYTGSGSLALPGGDVLVGTLADSIDGQPASRYVRLSATGAVDASFRPVMTDRTIVLAVFPDGRMLAGEPNPWQQVGHLYRWHPDGSLDTTFTPAAISFTGPLSARIALDGRIWLFGRFSFLDYATGDDVAVLNPDGTRTTSFVSPFTGTDATVYDVEPQPDGKVVVTGSFIIGAGANQRKNLARLHPDGSIDPTFTPAVSDEVYSDLTRLANGKFMATSRLAAARLNADGSIDATYAPALPETVVRVGPAYPSGRVYYYEGTGVESQLRRLDPNGERDAGFARFVAADPNGAPWPVTWNETVLYLDAPATAERSQRRQILTKLSNTGQLDEGFAPRFSVIGGIGFVGRREDGRYLVEGFVDYVNGQPMPGDLNLVLLRSDGTLDSAFAAPAVSPIALEPDGHFVARGDFGGGRSHARFRPDGTLRHVYADALDLSAVADRAGRLYTRTGTPPKLLRYLPDGTRDATYEASLPNSADTFTPAPDGSVYYIAETGAIFGQRQISRLDSTGALDAGFRPEVIWEIPFAMLALPDSSLLVVKREYVGNYRYGLRFVRFGDTGAPDFAYFGPEDRAVAASVLWELLQMTKGTAGAGASLSISLPEHALASWMHVRDDGQVTLLPGLQSFDETIPLERYTLQPAASPAMPRAPRIATEPAGTTGNSGGMASLAVRAFGLEPFTYQWYKDGAPIAGATNENIFITELEAADSGTYAVKVSNAQGAVLSAPAMLGVGDQPVVVTPPQSTVVTAGGTASISGLQTINGPTLQWRRNGVDVTGATATTPTLTPIEPEHAGLYAAVVTNGANMVESDPAVVGIFTAAKVAGAGEEIARDIYVATNGNTFDQVLLQGRAAVITADHPQDQITRISYIDLDDDIVQVEYSGPGTLTLVLENASGPAVPRNYAQNVSYMKGHANLVITGADERSHVSVFTVGRMTAHDPTGRFDITKPVSATNDPANNGSPLFVGHTATTYDGVADIGFIAVMSADGRFGSVRTANAHYFASRGYAGIYAPGVEFEGPVFVGDITAFDAAQPMLRLGQAADVRIAGGDLEQESAQPLQVSGLTKLRLTAGTDSHGRTLPAQQNRGVLRQSGIDVTAATVVNP